MKAILLLAMLITYIGFSATVNATHKPKNIIMLVGDGMGPAYTSAFRYFADDKASAAVETTVFDRLLVGMVSTYPSEVTGYVTDSAASATALSAGTKTYNGAIAVDVHKQPLPTVLEWAKSRGMKTGLAVTSQINHATPAAYVVHNESRNNLDQIADSYFDDRLNGQFKVDVMLGGGWQYFIRDDRNLVTEFTQAGYQYIDTYKQLDEVEKDKPLLGLFADKGLPWALDSKDKRRLLDLVKIAVKQLENDRGYFLLVEASQIDWAGHANDIAAAMAEMNDLAITMEWLENYVNKHPDTLIVLTADHSTGGLSVGGKDGYRWDPKPLAGLQASPELIATELLHSDSPAVLAESLLGFVLNEQEKERITLIKNTDIKSIKKVITDIVDIRSNTGWTTDAHSAMDVQIFAKGKGSELFAGHLDNTQIAKNIFQLLGKNQLH
jgi:alkaline phosphatase